MDHKIEVTLTGSFIIKDKDLPAYEAKDVHEAISHQLEWLEDAGDVISFVADTIEKPKLTLKVISSTITTDDL